MFLIGKSTPRKGVGPHGTTAAFEHHFFTEGTVAIGEDYVSRDELLASTFHKECLSVEPNAGLSGLGRLEADAVSTSNTMDAAILTALRRDPHDTPHFSRSVLVPRPSGRGSHTLQFSALGNHDEFGGGASGYAAIALLEHDSAKVAARVLNVSPDTVRSHVKQIYAKLGVDTRTRFVKVMLGLAGSKR